MSRKKFFYPIILALVLLSAVSSVFLVRAEDDDDEDDDDEYEYQDRSSSSSSSGKTETKTTVSTDVKTTVEKDSDGDGLFDRNDPHPDLPEIYLVKDDDRNGIVDDFEK